jgi:hypothetical protein
LRGVRIAATWASICPLAIAAGFNGTATTGAAGGGLRGVRIPSLRVRPLIVNPADDGGGGILSKIVVSDLEPLRPALSLPLIEVATRAATAKHATMILRGREKVMVEKRSNVKIMTNFSFSCSLVYAENEIWRKRKSLRCVRVIITDTCIRSYN